MAEPKQDAKPDLKDAAKEKKTVAKKKRAESISRYFRETKAELKKIVWPTPNQVFNNTIVVIVAILVVGVFIWVLDALTTSGFTALLNAFANK